MGSSALCAASAVWTATDDAPDHDEPLQRQALIRPQLLAELPDLRAAWSQKAVRQHSGSSQLAWTYVWQDNTKGKVCHPMQRGRESWGRPRVAGGVDPFHVPATHPISHPKGPLPMTAHKEGILPACLNLVRVRQHSTCNPKLCAHTTVLTTQSDT